MLDILLALKIIKISGSLAEKQQKRWAVCIFFLHLQTPRVLGSDSPPMKRLCRQNGDVNAAFSPEGLRRGSSEGTSHVHHVSVQRGYLFIFNEKVVMMISDKLLKHK